MSKVALITGITGQDGSYLAEFLLEKGYEVHGIVRRASISNTARIDHLIEKNVIKLHDGDLSDSSGLIRLVGEIRPDEIYNLAAQSHVQVSFDAPEYSGDVDALGVLRVLEAVRVCGLTKTCKVYQASTSELYGKVEEVPQKETTPFHPYSPYAVAKQYGFWMVKEYRDAYGMFAVNGILFNHESERRGENFVTRKITLAAGRIAEGLQDHLELGNMDSLRDWGYAKDYVECMWLIMQQEKPEDGGVFAYKLSYVMDKAHEMMDFTDYQDLFDKYDTMKKISFDYAVAEHEPKIQVVRFAGMWKDLGTWNAIGAGALVAEIQESSNLTYRLYDYDRIGKDGKKRELHIDKALDVADLHGSAEPRQPLRVLKYRPGMASELLIRCKYFEVYRMLINTERRQTVHYCADRMAFRVLLCMDGCGTISYDEGTVNFYKGDCVFVPADSEVLTIHGQAQFLDIRG